MDHPSRYESSPPTADYGMKRAQPIRPPILSIAVRQRIAWIIAVVMLVVCLLCWSI